jgi:hypothetical protein
MTLLSGQVKCKSTNKIASSSQQQIDLAEGSLLTPFTHSTLTKIVRQFEFFSKHSL